MKLSVTMDHDFGGYDINKYQIRISRHGGGVVSVGFPNNDPGMQMGAGLVIPAVVAGRLGLRSPDRFSWQAKPLAETFRETTTISQQPFLIGSHTRAMVRADLAAPTNDLSA